MMTYSFLKRMLDVVVSGAALMLLLPLLILLFLLVVVNMGWPAFFTQTRPGLGGKTFHIIKFRSMTNERGKDGVLLPEEKRITKLGRFIRSTSLDELPELLNVLRGDMSLVGPRPLLVEYVPLYSPEQRRRHDIRPGVTGWAQVNGRNLVSWDERFAMDVWYVDNRSFCLDMRIMLLTVVKVFKREGISPESALTMSKFTGSKEA